MVDCHMHMILDGFDWKAAIRRHANCPDEKWIREVLKEYQRLGFTYLRDGGDRWGAGKKAREVAPEYGIRYRTPLANLCKAGHYGAFIGEKYADFKEYTTLVRKARADGADFIKLVVSVVNTVVAVFANLGAAFTIAEPKPLTILPPTSTNFGR